MSYIGYVPAAKPLTSADITDSIITSAKIVDGTIANADISTTAAIATSKLGSGAVLQVVTATDSTSRSTTSTSFVTASNTLSVTITPSSTSNKVFITVNTSIYKNQIASVFALYKNASYINDFAFFGTGGVDPAVPMAFSYLDSPASTSALTYQLYFKSTGGANPIYIGQNNVLGTITAFEIAG